MEWSKYSTVEKWKIIKNMVVHNNIFSMALHIQDLELFKKNIIGRWEACYSSTRYKHYYVS